MQRNILLTLSSVFLMKMPNYLKTLSGYEYVGANGSVVYVLALNTTTDQVEKHGPVFDKMVQTFQLKQQVN